MGFTQIVLILIGLLGVGLLIYAIMGLLIRTRKLELLEDEDGNTYKRWQRRRYLRWRTGSGGILLVLIAFVLLWVASAIQAYMGFTGEVKVAHIYATRVQNIEHLLNVDLTLYNPEGERIARDSYGVKGDWVALQANILEMQPWANFLGIHSGYKLTRLFGQYEDVEMERTSERTVVELNGGVGDFFKAVENKQWWATPFARSAYGNIVVVPPGEYDIFVTRDAVIARPATA